MMPHRCLVLLTGALASDTAALAQPAAASIDYANDRTMRGGRIDSCIIVARASLPGPTQQLDFQLLTFAGLIGWRAAVSSLDPGGHIVSAGTVARVHFLDAGDMQAASIRAANKPDGQLVAYLVDMAYAKPLMASVFRGTYAVDIVGQGGTRRTYRAVAAPPKAVIDTFRACVDALTRG